MTPTQFARHISNVELPSYGVELDPECPLDRWITYAVKILRDAGIETYESCQGGPGHSYPEPAIRFHGQASEGYRAVAVAMTYGLPVSSLRRLWHISDHELEGPTWEIAFRSLDALRKVQKKAEAEGLLG